MASGRLEPVAVRVSLAKQLVERHHYLHSLPGGTRLAFGVFTSSRLMGAMTLGVGPLNANALVDGAVPDDCLTLSRLWLADELPRHSESRSIGVVLHSLKWHTNLKFLVSYADPAQGHLGTIYQATGWAYTGLSEAMPMYDIGDGKARHSRSLSHAYGTPPWSISPGAGSGSSWCPSRPSTGMSSYWNVPKWSHSGAIIQKCLPPVQFSLGIQSPEEF